MDVVLERRLARRAGKQLGLITRPQLVAVGLSRGQIARLLDSSRLVEIVGGVYLVGGAPRSDQVNLAAACLATGGVASHRSAAHLQGLVDLPPTRSEVTVGSTKGVRQGPVVHRSMDLLARDIVRVGGIRTTNATRTLIDLGGVVPSTTLEAALERALHARLTTFDRLVRRFFEVARHGRTGVGPLRSLLVDRDPLLAPAESDLKTSCAAPPQRIGGFAAGTTSKSPSAVPHKLDGFGTHSTRKAFEHDRARQNLLVANGWLPLVFTWRHLCHGPARVVANVRAARNQRLLSIS